MRREIQTVREVVAERGIGWASGAPLKRLPGRTAHTTKQMHDRLLRALGDRRIRLSSD